MNLNELKNPFEPGDIEFRAGATNGDKTKALALPYLTSRAVMDRLDSVCGPENWRDEYQAGPMGGVLCGISILVDGYWVTKFDGADNTNIEAVKGGLSDAFKRAAVKWGVGRYLYGLPAVWVKATPRGKSVVIDENEARAKMFGKQPVGNDPKQDAGRSFRTFDGLLFQLHQDFGLSEAEAKAKLKAAGYSSFKVSESGAMYEAIQARAHDRPAP